MNMQRKFLIASTILVAAALLVPALFSDSQSFEQASKDPEKNALDQALFTTQTIAGHEMDVPRPTGERIERLETLLDGSPGNATAALHLARAMIARGESEAAYESVDTFLNQNAGQFQDVAGFYHSRGMINREIEILVNGATTLTGAEAVQIYREIIDLQRQFLLDDPARDEVYQWMMRAQPDDASIVIDYSGYLLQEKRFSQAESVLRDALERFPDQELKLKSRLADVLQNQGKTDAALSLYTGRFAIDGELTYFEAFKDILRQSERLTGYSRELRRKARTGDLSEDDFVQLLLYYRSEREFDKAAKLISSWTAKQQPSQSSDLLTYARAFSHVQAHAQAEQFAYYAYLQTGTPEEQAEALLVMIEALSAQLYGGERLFADAFTGLDPRHLDTGIGFLGGVLSLLYNSADIDSAFSDLDRVRMQQQRADTIITLFDTFTSRHADHRQVAQAYSGVIQTLTRLGRHENAVEYAERFFDNYSRDPQFKAVAEAVLPAYRSLEKKQSIANTYRALIRWAERTETPDDYYRYIAELARHYSGENNLDAVVDLYWNEIQNNPGDEDLYSRFLSFLNSYRIFEEQEKVYKKAIEQFDDRSYYDKLARWYIRQKKDQDLRDFTRRVADVFKDSELYEFLREFIHLGHRASDADKTFYETIFRYANQRFPRNLNFVESLLSYYQRFKMWDDYEKLAFRYCYADENIRRQLLARLSKTEKLTPLLGQINQAQPELLKRQALLSAEEANTATVLFSLAALNWQSYFENALPLATELSQRCADYEPFRVTRAQLLRSLEELESAEEVYAGLATLSPTNKEYLIKAGELAIEQSGAAAAAEYWQQIPAIQPADEDLRKETATLFWDYYQYDKAIEVLLSARSELGNEALFGMEIGLLREEQGNLQAAIDEYIRFAELNDGSGYQEDRAIERLEYLADKHNLSNVVINSFNAALESSDYGFSTVRVFNAYLEYVDQTVRRSELLTVALDRFDTLAALEWLEDELRAARMAGAQEKALKKIARLNDNAPETLLALASLYERIERLEEAEAIYRQRLAETETTVEEMLPDYVAALQKTGEFYWRNKLFDKAVEIWKEQVTVTDGYQQKEIILRAADRLRIEERFEQAKWFAAKGLEVDPIDQQYFQAMAAIHAARENYPELNQLFKETIAAIRNSDSLSREARRARIQAMRQGLIENLTRMGDHMAAVDQYIEMINAEPGEEYLLEQAWRYAANHDLADHLTGYYRDTAQRSFKDYRWHTVLARFAALRGDMQTMTERLQRAVELEPQRVDLREKLARTYLATRAYEKAAEEFSTIFKLDRGNHYWQRLRAETMHLAGEEEKALEILRELISQAPKNISNHFQFAEMARQWRLFDPALEFINNGLDMLRQDIYQYNLTRSDLQTIVDTYVQSGNIMGAFNTLLDLNVIFANEANRQGNNRAWLARQGQTNTYNAFSDTLAPAVEQYADTEDLRAMETRLGSYLNGNNVPESTWHWVNNMAEALHFSALEEMCRKRLLGMVAGDISSSEYQNRFQNLAAFYQERDDLNGYAELLEEQLDGRTIDYYAKTMLELLADTYYMLGDEQNLRQTLKRYWSATSGDDSINFYGENTWVHRYLELLHSSGDAARLKEISTAPGQYAVQVINFLGRNGYEEMALETLNSFKQTYSPAWINSKRMLLGMRMNLEQGSWQLSSRPEELMRDQTIGRRISFTPAPETFFSGDDFYQFLTYYADFYFAAGEKESAYAMINGLPEAGTTNPEYYRQAARWYMEKKLYDKAESHLQTAEKVASDALENLRLEGEIAMARGNREQAVAAWRNLVDGDFGLNGYRVFFSIMRENALYEEARPAMAGFITGYLTTGEFWENQDVLNLLVEWSQKNNDESHIARQIIDHSRSLEQPLDFLSQIFNYAELSNAAKTMVMEEIIVLAREITLARPDDDDFATPVLKTWLEEAILFADRAEQYGDMLKWIRRYEENGYDDSPTYRLGSALRFDLLKSKALLGSGAVEDGLQFAREAIDSELGFDEELLKELTSAMKGMGLKSEALQLSIYFYQNSLDQGIGGYQYQLKLAELLLSRDDGGDSQRAASLVAGAMQGSVDDSSLITRGAEVLETGGLYGEAVELRQDYRQRVPQDFNNIRLLAHDLAATDQREEALELYRYLFDNRAPRSVQVAAIPDYVKTLGNLAGEELGRYRDAALSAQRESISVLAHALAVSAGDTVTAEAVSAAATENLHEPALFLAWTGGNAPYAEADGELLDQSLAYRPHTETALMLLENRLAADEPVLSMSDEWQYSEIQSLARYQFEERYGLLNEELLKLLPAFVERMMNAGLYHLALNYEVLREELARELGVSIDSQRGRIESAMDELEQAKNRFRITEAVSNK